MARRILFGKISSVAPTWETWLRKHYWWDREDKKKAQLLAGFEPKAPLSRCMCSTAVHCATTTFYNASITAPSLSLSLSLTHSLSLSLWLSSTPWRNCTVMLLTIASVLMVCPQVFVLISNAAFCCWKSLKAPTITSETGLVCWIEAKRDCSLIKATHGQITWRVGFVQEKVFWEQYN